jgi:uncharacterized repeat protein (TIGR01451 family)
MIDKSRGSNAWLPWTALLLAALIGVVLLGGGFETSQAQASPDAVDVQMTKTVDVLSVPPGQESVPNYTITFTNPDTSEVILDTIADTLPPGFEFGGMLPSSDWDQGPSDDVEPGIVWQGPITIPAESSLSLVYSVTVTSDVLPSIEPYENLAMAMAGDGSIGPATAGLLVGEADLALDKAVSAEEVKSGETVTFTVVVTNSGFLTGTIDVVTDTLDPALTFKAMATDSDVPSAPEEISNTLVWSGPMDVPPLGTLALRYVVSATTEFESMEACNEVQGLAEGGTLGPVETCITVRPRRTFLYLPLVFQQYKFPSFVAAKSASPVSLMSASGETVVYTVDMTNEGDDGGSIQTISDVLPEGFSFLNMEAGSDVTANPVVNDRTLTWTGPYAVPAGGQIRLIYRATPSEVVGQHVNAVSLTSFDSWVQPEPATAIVTVEPALLLEDHFENGMDQWTPFLNYWRLKPGQWAWWPDDGFNGTGGVTQDCFAVEDKEAEDALLMYLQPGSQDWTDYRVETKLILRTRGYPHGLWVRGHYQDVGKEDTAGWVTGYYIVAGGGQDGDQHYVRLAQLQTETDCWDAACNNPQNLYDFNNPHELTVTKKDGPLERWRWYTLTVEVKGNRIKAWLDGELYIDYVDEKEPFLTGTIGFKTYKADTVSFDDVIVTPIND